MSHLPFRPTGWYAVATSDELRPGDVQPRTLFGERWALFRNQSGRPAIVHATCPHLGANLGKGKVRGDNLHCPFHDFAFDTQGHCVGTPTGRTPKASNRTLPLVEQSGLILAWWDESGAPPDWYVPALEQEGWNRPYVRTITLKGHPQDTTENSVDVSHFTVVHGFDGVDVHEAVHTEGPHLSARYSILNSYAGIGLPVDFQVHAWGLGYSLVEAELPTLRSRSRLFVLATPTEPGQIELRLGSCAPTGRLTKRIWGALIRHFSTMKLVQDASADIPIWDDREHIERPALTSGEGAIMKYRRWCTQFYPQPQQAESAG